MSHLFMFRNRRHRIDAKPLKRVQEPPTRRLCFLTRSLCKHMTDGPSLALSASITAENVTISKINISSRFTDRTFGLLSLFLLLTWSYSNRESEPSARAKPWIFVSSVNLTAGESWQIITHSQSLTRTRISTITVNNLILNQDTDWDYA